MGKRLGIREVARKMGVPVEKLVALERDEEEWEPDIEELWRKAVVGSQ